VARAYLPPICSRIISSQCSRANAGEIDELERRWDNLVDRLGSESLPDFLRLHWNSRNAFVRHSELFKVIRNRITSAADVFTLLREMDEDIDTYLALHQPAVSQWDADWQRSAQELLLFSVRQPYPMLMAAKRRLSDADLGELLRASVVISFRYNVIGSLHPGDQERVYNTVALAIHQGAITTLAEAINALRPIYRSDAAFRADFAEAALKTTHGRKARIVRYILGRLEKQVSGQDFDTASALYTIIARKRLGSVRQSRSGKLHFPAGQYGSD